MKGKIVNNKCICPVCENSNFSGIRDYDLVEWQGIKMMKYTRRCKECDSEVTYYKTISMEGDKYYDVNEDEVNVIK